MNEIARGIYHWTALHEGIGAPVSSYYIEPAATAIDPMVPGEGLGFFDGRRLEQVVLTNRHHYRQGDDFAITLGIPVSVVEQGEHEVHGRPGVRTFAFGDEVVPGITSYPIEPSWPDEGALHIAVGKGLLALGDSAMHYGPEISFVADEHLGDDPASVKVQLRTGLGRLLDLEFDTLLFAHGPPIVGDGKSALRAFVDADG
jgi:hypothetical protein